MNRFCGVVGYLTLSETKPGVWTSTVVEHTVYGDVLKNNTRNIPSPGVNDNITISNQISIVSDPYSLQNLKSIKYVKFEGVAWKVLSIEVQHPRLILTLGGEYNGSKT